MNLPEKYMKDFLVRSTYHSVAIEGYDVTPKDVISILLEQQNPKNMNTNTITIIDNHRYAIELVIRKAVNHGELSFPFLFELHHRLMKNIDANLGQFKTEPNKIKGSKFIPASPEETPILMKQSVDDINKKFATDLDQEDRIALVVQFAIVFEHIQPFQTGNNMLARLAINYLLIKEDIAPWIISVDDAAFYQKLLHKQDTDGLTHFAKNAIQDEKRRIHTFI